MRRIVLVVVFCLAAVFALETVGLSIFWLKGGGY
jgi:hypothetical protein